MARRQVSVELILEALRFLRPAREVLATAEGSAHAIGTMGDKADAASRDMEQLAVTTDVAKRQVDDLGDKARVTAADLTALQARIDATRMSVQGLALDFARTGNAGAARGLASEQSELARLERVQKLLTPQGSGGFLGNLLGNIPEIGGVPGPVVAALGAGLVAASPFLGGLIASTILGAGGTGGLIGGILIAGKDPRVKNAWQGLGHSVFTDLTSAADPLIEPVVNAASRFAGAWRQELPAVRAMFNDLSKAVDPLAAGVTGFVHGLTPGLANAIKASIPLADQFSTELTGFGTALGDMFDSIAESEPGARAALHDLFVVTDQGVVSLGDTVKLLSETYDGLQKLHVAPPPEWLARLAFTPLPTNIKEIWDEGWGAVISGADQGTNVTAAVRDLRGETEKSLSPTEQYAKALKDQADAATANKRALDALKKTTEDYYRAVQAPLDAAERWEAAVDNLTASVKENGKTLDIHTEKGRANRDAIEEMAAAAKGLLDTGQLSEQQYLTQIDLIEQLATKLGLPRQQVDELVAGYKKLPSQIATDYVLNINGMGNAFALLKAMMGGGALPALTMGEHSGGRVGTLTQQPSGGPGGSSHQAFIEGRAGGGEFMAGVPYLVGERGPEIAVFGQPGTVYPSSQAYAAAAPMGTPVVHVYIGGERINERIDVRVEMAQKRAGDMAMGGVR